MSVYVVRHAKAGDRDSWDGDDRLRPLSKTGRQQAAALATRLAPAAPAALVASPFVRCVQTLEPIGEAVGLPVRSDDRLSEGAALEDVIALIAELGDGAVLSSHGDVIPDLIRALERRGMTTTTPPDWRKATIWVLDGLDGDGRFASAAVEPPPSV